MERKKAQWIIYKLTKLYNELSSNTDLPIRSAVSPSGESQLSH